MPTLSIQPLAFRPEFEQIPEDEGKTTEELIAALRRILETTASDEGRGLRAVHAKSHGVVTGELEPLPGLPEALAQGVFAQPGPHPVILRFSTNPGDLLPDTVSTPRGLAIKILGVAGERLPGSEGDTTQDFVLVNAPAFAAPTPKKFLGNLKLLAGTTDKAPRAKAVLSAVLRGVESAVEAVGGESATLKNLGGHPPTHILGETFYSAVPMRHGPYYAKLSIAPVDPALVALTDQKIDLAGRPDALREEVDAHMARHGGVWEVRVQLATDIERMPIEDASVVWPEDVSPYVAVARITVPPQPSWTPARAKALDEGLAFSPWHGLAEHRPLGGIMRTRKPAYAMSSAFRGQRNGCPMHEPRDQVPLSE